MLPTTSQHTGSVCQSICCCRLPAAEVRCLPLERTADWLLNHPNIDILEQQLLSPLIQQGEQAEQAEQGQQAEQAKRHLLRVGLVTLGERWWAARAARWWLYWQGRCRHGAPRTNAHHPIATAP